MKRPWLFVKIRYFSGQNESLPHVQKLLRDGPLGKLLAGGGGGRTAKNSCTASSPEIMFLHTERIFLQGKC